MAGDIETRAQQALDELRAAIRSGNIELDPRDVTHRAAVLSDPIVAACLVSGRVGIPGFEPYSLNELLRLVLPDHLEPESKPIYDGAFDASSRGDSFIIESHQSRFPLHGHHLDTALERQNRARYKDLLFYMKRVYIPTASRGVYVLILSDPNDNENNGIERRVDIKKRIAMPGVYRDQFPNGSKLAHVGLGNGISIFTLSDYERFPHLVKQMRQAYSKGTFS